MTKFFPGSAVLRGLIHLWHIVRVILLVVCYCNMRTLVYICFKKSSLLLTGVWLVPVSSCYKECSCEEFVPVLVSAHSIKCVPRVNW